MATSDPIVLTTTVYTRGCRTSTSNSTRPVLWPSSPSPVTHSCSSYVPSWLVAPLLTHLAVPRPLPLHCTCLRLGSRCRTCVATQVKVLKGPGQQAGLSTSAPQFRNSLILCTTLCPACPELELPGGDLPGGDPCWSFDTSQQLLPLHSLASSSFWL